MTNSIAQQDCPKMGRNDQHMGIQSSPIAGVAYFSNNFNLPIYKMER